MLSLHAKSFFRAVCVTVLRRLWPHFCPVNLHLRRQLYRVHWKQDGGVQYLLAVAFLLSLGLRQDELPVRTALSRLTLLSASLHDTLPWILNCSATKLNLKTSNHLTKAPVWLCPSPAFASLSFLGAISSPCSVCGGAHNIRLHSRSWPNVNFIL